MSIRGTEFVSRDFNLWAYQRGVTLDFSRPGKPTDNAFIEAFNSRFPAECLNAGPEPRGLSRRRHPPCDEVARRGDRGVTRLEVSKDKQAHKIDVVVALGMAALAAVKAQGQSTYDASLSRVNGPTTGTEAERNAEWRRQRFAVYVGSGGMIRL